MEFQAQTITVKTAQGEKSFPVMVGVGSGLAYHHLDNDPDADFILTHVASGFGIASEWYAWEEKDARRWLEKVANLLDRKSTRLNSSHQIISYAVFCLKKKKKHKTGLANS